MRKLFSQPSKELKDIFALVSGNGAALLIPILISPILTRLFSESDFGELTLFISIVAIIGSFSTGRYNMAILEAKTIDASRHLAFLSFMVSIAVSLVVFLGIVVISNFEALKEYINLSKFILFLIPVSVLISSLFQIGQSALNREKYYTEISKVKVSKSTGASVFQLLGGYLKVGGIGLVAGKVLGDFVGAVHGIVSLIAKEKYFSFDYSKRKLFIIAKRYDKYLKVNSLQSFLNATTSNVPALILAFFFSNEIVGYYGLSYRVCFLPVTMISTAFFQVFSREIVIKIEETNNPITYFNKNTRRLVKLSTIPFLTLLLFGPQIFEFVFGQGWGESGRYAQILAPYLFMVFIVSPFTFVPLTKNLHVKSFKIEIVSLILKVASLFAGAKFFGVLGALVLFSLSGFAVQIYLYIWIRGILKNA